MENNILINNKTIDFISKSRLIHGNLYDYSLVKYNGCREKVEIICEKHGIFKQKPIYHLIGRGCKRCIDDEKNDGLRYFYI